MSATTRREKMFFGDEDTALYRDLLAEACRRNGVAVWAYCLMPNPRPPDPDAADPGGSRAGARQGASALF
jgi:REP-associated tyrosine transposase